jgi:hypothetical protein
LSTPKVPEKVTCRLTLTAVVVLSLRVVKVVTKLV